jgi:hypothetical protein
MTRNSPDAIVAGRRIIGSDGEEETIEEDETT